LVKTACVILKPVRWRVPILNEGQESERGHEQDGARVTLDRARHA
jgi:hypothetical protein